MRFVFFALALVVSSVTPSVAQQWVKLLDCSDGAAVIDSKFQGTDRSSTLQFVIRDSKAIRHLLDSGAVFSDIVNSRHEIVMPVEWNIPDYFQDFSYRSEVSAYRPNGREGRFYIVKPLGDRLTLEAFIAERPNPLAPFVKGPRVGSWTFEGCRRNR